jgi:hypothetical protein
MRLTFELIISSCALLNISLGGCFERFGCLTWIQAGMRQVKGATVGLQHNLGLGGACVVTVYKKPTDSWAGVVSGTPFGLLGTS